MTTYPHKEVYPLGLQVSFLFIHLASFSFEKCTCNICVHTHMSPGPQSAILGTEVSFSELQFFEEMGKIILTDYPLAYVHLQLYPW